MKFDTTKPVTRLVLGAVCCACITVLTMTLAIPIPGLTGAYINLGDAGVYLAAFLLGGPFGALCAGIGSALADIMLGSALYAIPTFIIKAGMAFIAATLYKQSGYTKRIFPLACAGLVMPLGYFLFETMLYGAAGAAIGIIPNLIQCVGGIMLGLCIVSVGERVLKRA